MNTPALSDREKARPSFPVPARLCLSLVAFFFWHVIMSGLEGAVARHYGFESWVLPRDVRKLSPAAQAVIALLGAERTTLAVFCIFAALFYLLLSRHPRVAAGLLVGIGVVGVGPAVFSFGRAFGMIGRHAFDDHDGSMGDLLGELSYCVFNGLLPLMTLATADELDRATVARTESRRVEQAEGASPERYRRARQRRDLIATASGGALRPWMAVACILPMALLPAFFVMQSAKQHWEIRMYSMLAEVRMPALATAAHRARPENLRLRLALDDNGGLMIGTRRLPLPAPSFGQPPPGSAEAWNAAIQELRAQSPGNAHLELDIAPQVDFQQMVDLLTALHEAGFRDIVFTDDPA